MSANAPAAPAKEKPKSKKMMIIIIVVVALLVVAGGAAAWLLSSAPTRRTKRLRNLLRPKRLLKRPRHFFPLRIWWLIWLTQGENGFAQIGITLEVADAKTGFGQAIHALYSQRHLDAGLPAHF